MANLLRPGQLNVTTGTGDNDTVTTKGYVDDQAGAGSAVRDVLTVTTPGQTAFTLSTTPQDVTVTQFYLNGQLRTYSTDYTISGTSLTWNDPGGLTLKTSDGIQVWINVSIGGGIYAYPVATPGVK